MGVYLNGEEVGVIVNSGSAPEPPATKGKYRCLAIDYDGTILKEQWLNTGDIFALPDAPTHDSLIFDGWSSPVTITDNTLTVDEDNIIAGAMYRTESGLTELEIELTSDTGLDVKLNMDGTKNWGDGSSDTATTHTYSSMGKYLITCDGTTISSKWNNSIVGSSTSQTSANNVLVKCRLGNLQTLGSSFCFGGCNKLESVSLPSSISSFGDYAFTSCHNLKGLVCPPSITQLGRQAFYECYKLKDIVLPKELLEIPSTAFFQNYYLELLSIPDNVTTLGPSALEGCYSLTQIVIPSKCKTIKATAFNSCLSLRTLYFSNGNYTIQSSISYTSPFFKIDFSKVTSIPTMTSQNAFGSIGTTTSFPEMAKIYVPDSLYDDWIVATNWTTYANQIYKASEMEVE